MKVTVRSRRYCTSIFLLKHVAKIVELGKFGKLGRLNLSNFYFNGCFIVIRFIRVVIIIIIIMIVIIVRQIRQVKVRRDFIKKKKKKNTI